MRYLLVEGITDIAFIKYICLEKNITTEFNAFKKEKSENDQIEVYSHRDMFLINLKSQDKLKYVLKNILFPKEKKITKIGIIQDADDNFTKSKDDIEKALKESKINKNKTEYFLTPNNSDNGDLETLLLSTLKNNKIINCFDDYEKCLKKDSDIHPKALNKGKVYAYTMYSQSGKNLYKPQDSFINKEKDTKLWDLNKKEFAPCTDFVVDFFK